ncbi:MAG: response regulator [Novosphingobium sp.]|nr:response regulator [Novosphingobium sp.]
MADDDAILVEMVRFRLEGAGHKVLCASDGEVALDLARTERPDLIVLDSMMPIVSGPEVLARLKADEQLKAIPVVMLTARKGESDVVAALQSGVDEYLTKPFIPRELLVRIDSLLNNSL